jgi:putative flavoprotein involved in K+ transport
VAHDAEGFKVRYRGRDEDEHVLEASHVINATGIISQPQLPPDFKPDACSFRWMHSIKARAPALADARRVLVVGGGASAAEVLERWLEVRSQDAHAWLSLRSALVTVPHWILGIDVHYFVWLPEQFPTSLLGWRAGRLREPMTGLAVRRAIREGLITRTPAVQSYHGDTVTLKNGERLQPDLVVFSTGFRYASEHLDQLVDRDPDRKPVVKNCESTRTRGLYLLGFRFGRTFASPYLRGIARDAEYVAERIAGEVT